MKLTLRFLEVLVRLIIHFHRDGGKGKRWVRLAVRECLAVVACGLELPKAEMGSQVVVLVHGDGCVVSRHGFAHSAHQQA